MPSALIVFLWWGVTITPIVISFQKGKPGLALFGLAGFFLWLPPYGLAVLVAIVGAIRLARPHSLWAREHYDPDGDKMRLAIQRFPGWRPAT